MKNRGMLILFLLSFALNGYAWHFGTVDSVGDVGRYISADIPGRFSNEWYISYYDSTNGDLKCFDGNRWGVRTIDTTGDVGKYTSVKAFCRTRDPAWISYYDATNGNLKCAYYDGTADTFTIQTVDSICNVGLFTSVDVDTFGHPHISYYDATNKDLKYARWDSSGWDIEVVDSAGDVGMYSSIGIDTSTDSIYISYYDATNGDLKLAIWDGASWNIQKLDTLSNVGMATSIRVYYYEKFIKISYYDATSGNLKLAQREAGSWKLYIIDEVGDVGSFSSIERGEDWGGYYSSICYYDRTNGRLKLSGGTLAGTIGDAGSYCAYITGCEFLFLPYYDATNGDLRCIWEIGGAEEQSTVNSEQGAVKAWPNPFTQSTVISEQLSGKAKETKIRIYDISGKLVESFDFPPFGYTQGKQDKGNERVIGKNLKAGVYFVRVGNSEPIKIIKMGNVK